MTKSKIIFISAKYRYIHKKKNISTRSELINDLHYKQQKPTLTKQKIDLPVRFQVAYRIVGKVKESGLRNKGPREARSQDKNHTGLMRDHCSSHLNTRLHSSYQPQPPVLGTLKAGAHTPELVLTMQTRFYYHCCCYSPSQWILYRPHFTDLLGLDAV